MGKKGVYGKGPVDISRHQELAEGAGRKARTEGDPDRRRSLENLQRDHQRIADTKNVRRRRPT